VFEWTDEWWKSIVNNTSDAAHDAPAPPAFPLGDFSLSQYTSDPTIQEEWWGLAGLSTTDNKRTLRQGYYALKAFWNPAVQATASRPLITELRNFPNPLKIGQGATRIRVALDESATLTVGLFDLGGERVIELKNPQPLGGNVFEFPWSGQTEGGRLVASGLYLCRVEARTASRRDVQFRRIVVVR